MTNRLDEFKDNIIVKHYAGSKAYGTSTPQSDTDFRGIFMAPKKYILTPFHEVNEFEDSTEEDTKYFELNNYMKLYLDANPNILESLWVNDESIVQRTPEYDIIRNVRADLLSERIAFTYTGYAHNQVTRMVNHNSWIGKEQQAIKDLQDVVNKYSSIQVKEWVYENFPDFVVEKLDFSSCSVHSEKINTAKLMRNTAIQMICSKQLRQSSFVSLVHNYTDDKVLSSNFSIEDYVCGYSLVPYGSDMYGLIVADAKSINTDGSLKTIAPTLDESVQKQHPLFIVKFAKEEYKRQCDNHNSYFSWKANRNAVRAQLEVLHGYDCKHAMHVVRLLRTAREALETGTVQVFRPDAEELLAIRNGSWTYAEMIKYWESESKYIREVLSKKNVLPKKPNIELATKVLIEMRDSQFYK